MNVVIVIVYGGSLCLEGYQGEVIYLNLNLMLGIPFHEQGNTVLCGLRNGLIVTVDVRQRQLNAVHKHLPLVVLPACVVRRLCGHVHFVRSDEHANLGDVLHNKKQ